CLTLQTVLAGRHGSPLHLRPSTSGGTCHGGVLGPSDTCAARFRMKDCVSQLRPTRRRLAVVAVAPGAAAPSDGSPGGGSLESLFEGPEQAGARARSGRKARSDAEARTTTIDL